MKNKKKLTVLILVVAVMSFAVGSFAWFLYSQKLNTVSLVQMPSKLTIAGPNHSEMTRISLELTPDDTQNGDEVTIRRVFCIESTAEFRLEVIRTTNIQGMDIKIYPVKIENSDQESGIVKGTDGESIFYYTPELDYITGSYLNQVADQEYAIPENKDNTLHGENYVPGDDVQKNAEPLYWRAGQTQSISDTDYSADGTATDGTVIKYRYYVLELSWTTTAQETDMVYLLASH